MNDHTDKNTLALLQDIIRYQSRKRYFLSLSIAPTVALLLVYVFRNSLPAYANSLALFLPFIHLCLLAQLFKFILNSDQSAEHIARFLMSKEPNAKYNTIIVTLFVSDKHQPLTVKKHARYTAELAILIVPLILTPFTYLTLLNPTPSSFEATSLLSLITCTLLFILLFIYRSDKHKSPPDHLSQNLSG